MLSMSSVSTLSWVEVLPDVIIIVSVEAEGSRCHLPIISSFGKRMPHKGSLG